MSASFGYDFSSDLIKNGASFFKPIVKGKRAKPLACSAGVFVVELVIVNLPLYWNSPPYGVGKSEWGGGGEPPLLLLLA